MINLNDKRILCFSLRCLGSINLTRSSKSVLELYTRLHRVGDGFKNRYSYGDEKQQIYKIYDKVRN